MDLFEKLKEKYTEKVVILTRENLRMKCLLEQNGIDPNTMPENFANTLQALQNQNESSDSQNSQGESVDK